MPGQFFSTVLLLLLLLDPLGNIPLVTSLLRRFAPARRQRILLRESLIAGALLLLFTFAGDWLIAAAHLSAPAIEISGGLILFLIALRMVFPPASLGEEPGLATEPLIVPIAVPMIVGPATLATVLMNARQSDQDLWLALAIIVAMLVNTLILLSSDAIARLFGRAGMTAMERLMGLALTVMSVQMLITGLRAAFLAPLP